MRQLLLLTLVTSSCASYPLAPVGLLTDKSLPAWLFCVEKDSNDKCAIYRSAQPTADEFDAMKSQLGIESVIKLNSALEGRDVLPDGVARFEHPWSPVGPVSHEDLDETLVDLENAPRPVDVHCTHGEDRTGLLIGLYRIKHGSLASAAWREMIAYGFHPALFGLTATFKRETD